MLLVSQINNTDLIEVAWRLILHSWHLILYYFPWARSLIYTELCCPQLAAFSSKLLHCTAAADYRITHRALFYSVSLRDFFINKFHLWASWDCVCLNDFQLCSCSLAQWSWSNWSLSQAEAVHVIYFSSRIFSVLSDTNQTDNTRDNRPEMKVSLSTLPLRPSSDISQWDGF